MNTNLAWNEVMGGLPVIKTDVLWELFYITPTGHEISCHEKKLTIDLGDPLGQQNKFYYF